MNDSRQKYEPRPDYSGRWRFDAGASQLQIGDLDAVEFVIEHNEPFFHLERTLTFGGRTDTFSIDLKIGAEHEPFVRGDATIYPLIRWDRDLLVFVSRIVRNGEDATNSVRYQLVDGGTVLVAEESFRSPRQNYDNRWVFTKLLDPPRS